MIPSRYGTVIGAIPFDIRDVSAVDRQADDEILSKVRSSLHNQTTAFLAIGPKRRSRRIGLAASRGEGDCISESENKKEPGGGLMS
jgi:hypothetical protein